MIDYVWNPEDKIYYLLFITTVKLGDWVNVGLPAPLKCSELSCTSAVACWPSSPLSRKGQGII